MNASVPIHVSAAFAEVASFAPDEARATALIECVGLGHQYEARDGTISMALANVDLRIEAGEFLCLLGPSGCGKTTLLNMIAGFVRPTQGYLRVAGLPVRGPSPERGVVFQEYSLFPWLTLAGNVAFGLRMAGVRAAERQTRVEKHLAAVGLNEAARRYPFELSGGMKQRAAIARALATDPSILLMDEPFAALDAMTRRDLQVQLLEIHRNTRKTVVFVTHNIAEAVYLASRVIVMSPHPGRIVDDISLADFEHPRRRTSARFNSLYERLSRAIGAEVSE
ncbi:putative aliphatic sulfonate ABC transporter ATP-binding protein [Pandoraea communis]|uniref:Putative aliphatic sulfonate ABC transporter ATP-binding protein n=1 Tax=Pandoraea communis TaxID=2508297 RepID=A0A5E4YQR3_9BURK|nr:ABC transporter ATP-binding protein [Pandoraea communis]VVE51121.1 putative aliphatic sulfonate ABC transporter ATP-binding protein [Pandoraea communis]